MTEQQTIYQEVSALLITLFEIAPEDITLRHVFTRIWTSTALMPSIWWCTCKENGP